VQILVLISNGKGATLVEIRKLHVAEAHDARIHPIRAVSAYAFFHNNR
jgi:hypothetical protein